MAADLPCPRCEGWMAREGERWRCPACGLESEDEPLGTHGLAAGVSAPGLGDTRHSLAPPRPRMPPGFAPLDPGPDEPRPVRGKRRSFGVSLLLGVVTLGLYFLYWQWVVFAEMHLQAGGRHRATLLALSVASALAQVVWSVLLPGERLSEPAGFGDPVGLALALVTSVLSTAYLVLEGRDLDRVLRALGLPPASATGPLVAAAVLMAVAGVLAEVSTGLFLALAVVAILVELAAFRALQRGLNRFWGDARAASAPPTALTPAPS